MINNISRAPLCTGYNTFSHSVLTGFSVSCLQSKSCSIHVSSSFAVATSLKLSSFCSDVCVCSVQCFLLKIWCYYQVAAHQSVDKIAVFVLSLSDVTFINSCRFIIYVIYLELIRIWDDKNINLDITNNFIII